MKQNGTRLENKLTPREITNMDEQNELERLLLSYHYYA